MKKKEMKKHIYGRIADVRDGVSLEGFVKWMSDDFDGAKDLWEAIKEWGA